MTTTVTETEAAFQRALDANPSSSELRRILADHLEDVGDERSDGYRALGVLGRWPREGDPADSTIRGWMYWAETDRPQKHTEIGKEWWFLWKAEVRRRTGLQPFALGWPSGPAGTLPYRLPTRREADDAAAIAFSRLPADVRAAILAGEGQA